MVEILGKKRTKTKYSRNRPTNITKKNKRFVIRNLAEAKLAIESLLPISCKTGAN